MSRLASWAIRRTWWFWRWIVLLRERQLRVHGAAELIAAELDAQADAIRTAGAPEPEFQAWMQHRSDLFAISRKDRQLWDDVQAMYAELQRRATRGGKPPPPEQLEELAGRLRASRF